MARTTMARKGRPGRKAALVGAAAATAVAMTAGVAATPGAPAANAALVLDATTTGPLLWAAEAFGLDTVVIPNVDVIGDITINLAWTDSDPVNLYDTVNNPAFFGGWNLVTRTFTRPNVLAGSTPTGPLLVASGLAVPNAVKTYKALLASANGQTPTGYTPLTPGGRVNAISGVPCTTSPTCGVQATNVTNLPLALLRDPGTPNGGLYARFAPILNLFGIDPITPGGTTASSTGLRLNTAEVNVALGYDALSDFPATLNPFSLVNSVLAAVLPTYLLGGFDWKGDSTDTILTRIGLLAALGTTSTSYSTLAPKDLPLLEPLRLPSRILNAVFDAVGLPIHLGTPLADALQPALTILVNTGYTDVQTPSEGGTYNRTYDQSGVYTPFLSQAPLTPQEWLQVPGDVVKALIGGFTDEIKKIFGLAPSPVASVPASVSASLRGSPVTQSVSPTASSQSQDPTPVGPVDNVDAGAPAHDPTPRVRASRDGSGDTSVVRDAHKATAHREHAATSDNAGEGRQAKKDSPSHSAASARSSKSAA
ncbi:MAG: PE-PPE domain-containing protein [Mycobacterium sp.]